jgi:hypothetical protein
MADGIILMCELWHRFYSEYPNTSRFGFWPPVASSIVICAIELLFLTRHVSAHRHAQRHSPDFQISAQILSRNNRDALSSFSRHRQCVPSGQGLDFPTNHLHRLLCTIAVVAQRSRISSVAVYSHWGPLVSEGGIQSESVAYAFARSKLALFPSHTTIFWSFLKILWMFRYVAYL